MESEVITLRKLIESCKDMDDDALDAELWVRVGLVIPTKEGGKCVIGSDCKIKEIPDNWDINENRFYLEGDC